MARRLIFKRKKQDGSKQGKTQPTQSFKKSYGRTAVIGLFGGLFWSFTGLICHLLNFSKIGPELILLPLPLPGWKAQMAGGWLAVALLTLLSVPVAFMYSLLLGRLQSFWIGPCFGLLMWGVIFLVLPLGFQALPSLIDRKFIDWNTATTTWCLFLLYGLFIGRSITFETDTANSSQGNYSND
ncbi:MAG: YqhR family membrane protein [Sporolactobacillus sp.]